MIYRSSLALGICCCLLGSVVAQYPSVPGEVATESQRLRGGYSKAFRRGVGKSLASD